MAATGHKRTTIIEDRAVEPVRLGITMAARSKKVMEADER